jgi:AcrR family transcriptional regulator
MDYSQLLTTDNKTDRRIKRTKKAISTSFLKILKEKEISKITIKEICELADINRKTFYAYYNSISDVLSEIENSIIVQFHNQIMERKSSISKIEIDDIFECIAEILTTHSELVYMLVQIDDLMSLEKKVKDTIKQCMFEILSQNHTYQQDMLNLTLEYIVSGAVSTYIEWFYCQSKVSLKTLSELTITLVNSNIESSLAFHSL